MGFMDSLNVSASGMTAERLRLDVISNNLANANTTRGPGGGPFQRKAVVLSPGENSFASMLTAVGSGGGIGAIQNAQQASELSGVQVTGIIPDQTPFKEVYDPGNPDANARGYVRLPNVNVITEMVDMMGASRAYEADVTAVNSAKGMAMKALDIGRA
ncbi:MAG: flagellar basal body rod protein FlgC [Capsulimonadaceae bacterium]|nr:flagellar basal body rod protein FlgC [Capsulimonadaceae bacterium]